MGEQILQQQTIVENEQKKLCDVLAAASGTNVHEVKWVGIQKEETLHLVLRLRGGMYSETSGKDGMNELTEEDEMVIEEDGDLALLKSQLLAVTGRAAMFEIAAEHYMQLLQGKS